MKKNIELPQGFTISCDYRHVDHAGSVVFVHGFGSAKEHFRYAFDDSSLGGFTVATVDLVGFGESRGPADFDYTMAEQARVMFDVIDRVGVGRFHLCAHSMGGLVAIEMAEMEPDRVLSVINMEGNLTPEDCFFSGKLAGYSFEEFKKRGKRRFREKLEEVGGGSSVMSEYLETFSMATNVALHKSAVHMVADSSTRLIDRFSRLRNVCYIYGEKNRGMYPGEKLLLAEGVPLFYIKDAGHSMATENPGALYRTIYEFIDGLR